ncbi:MAG: histidine kinase [Ferruginibacter sp.]
MTFKFHTSKTNTILMRIVLHLLFWIGIVCYFAWGFGISGNVKESFINALGYIPGQMILMYALLYFLTPRYLVKKKYISFVIGLIIVILICAGYASLANLALSINKKSFSGVSLNTGRNILPFIHVAGIAFSIKFLNFWHQQKQQTIEAQREQLTTELELLKSQVHPHFLFNTLNNLYAYTLERSEKAPEIVLKLSNLLRFMIYESRAASISLGKEVLLLQSYIELEQLRYGDRLDVSFTSSGVTNDKLIAPLLLLPFLENAFKHGTSRQIDQCWISFDLHAEGSALQFKLVNSVDKEDKKVAADGGLGLQNVRRRLSLLYPGKHKLMVQSDEEVFIVNLELELDEANEADKKNSFTIPTIEKSYELEMPDRRR